MQGGSIPFGELNDWRTSAVEDAIKAIEAATTQPKLRSITSAELKDKSSKPITSPIITE